MTKKKVLLILFATFIAVTSVFAKRLPPPELEPITVNGLEYNVDYHISPFSERASITITDNTNPEITSVRFVKLYSKIFIPFSETDVQWVFVKKMELTDNDTIRFYREDNKIHEFNLKDESVKKTISAKSLRIAAIEIAILLSAVLFGYAIYRLIRRELQIRSKIAIERTRELSKAGKVESLYKNDREFRRMMLKRDLAAVGFFFVFLIACFIIILIALLLKKHNI